MRRSIYRRNVELKNYRVMVDGEIVDKVLRAETLDYAQVQALNEFGNTPNVIAMSQAEAGKYL